MANPGLDRSMGPIRRVCKWSGSNRTVSNFEIRRLTADPSERDAAAGLLAESFFDSPLFLFAFPEADTRRVMLRFLFGAIVDDALRFGCVEAAFANQIVGALLWYPPGKYPMPLYRELYGLRSYLPILLGSPIGLLKLYRVQAALGRLRPERPHCHAYFLAGQTGLRTGVALSCRVLEEADANNWPIYLETQDPRAVLLYRRLGFLALHSGVEILPGVPATWTMWKGSWCTDADIGFTGAAGYASLATWPTYSAAHGG